MLNCIVTESSSIWVRSGERKLEEEVEDAVAEVIVSEMGLKKSPLLPSRQTIHLMA